MKVLVTGGAGFIGSRLTRRLLTEGCRVTVLDNFSPQIHAGRAELPADLAGRVTLVRGDVSERAVLASALADQEVVVHLAAETGTGQSMYEVERYQKVNLGGTALLFDLLTNGKTSVRKVVTASSRAIYGEGKYRCPSHGVVYPGKRRAEDVKAGKFEPLCPTCRAECSMLPTDESSAISPASFYGITKQVQEQMTLMFGEVLGISAFALRYQNVYGPGQSLSNPYTGILAIFSNLARAGRPINVFEDGMPSRDFVYIDDVVEATWRCIKPETRGVAALNVGGGQSVTVHEIARSVVEHFGSASPVTVSGAFREGDIRHNLADLTKARALIGYEPKVKFADGLREFLSWAAGQQAVAVKYEQSLQELKEKGLLHG